MVWSYWVFNTRFSKPRLLYAVYKKKKKRLIHKVCTPLISYFLQEWCSSSTNPVCSFILPPLVPRKRRPHYLSGLPSGHPSLAPCLIHYCIIFEEQVKVFSQYFFLCSSSWAEDRFVNTASSGVSFVSSQWYLGLKWMTADSYRNCLAQKCSQNICRMNGCVNKWKNRRVNKQMMSINA